MSTPTAAELALLRTQPHLTKLYLSIYKPTTLFSCRVNDAAAAKGDRVITYDGGVGDYNDTEIGMTVYVGTTAGGKDKGSIYLFGRNATTITVGENSHIDWADDDYITVVNFYQIWPVYPRYVQSDTDITVYKAYDVAYTNQNEIGGFFICMGPHRAGFLSTGSASVYYTASGTSNVKGVTGSYVWEIEGGTPAYVSGTAATALTPGWVTYSTPGHYTTRLTVRGTDGSGDLAARHVSIYNRPEEGTSVPILKWGLDSLSGSRDTGGYQARIWVEEDIDDIVDGALIVIFSDDYYGATQQSIGGNAINADSIVFTGYIMDGSIERDYQRNRVTFEVGSPTEIMKIGEAFSVSVEDSQNPTNDASEKGGDPWFYYKDLTVKTALYHYTRWHTILSLCADIQYVGDDFAIQFFDCDRSSLYDALHTFLKSTKFGNVVCDMQGKIWFETEAEAVDGSSTAFPVSMFIDKHDWINNPTIEEKQIPSYSYIEMGGVAYSGSTGTYTPLLAAAPGSTPAYRGHNEKLSGLALTNQAQLNALAGNIYAARNAKYPSVRLDIAGNYRVLDIAPQEIVRLTMAASENHRGASWTQKPFTIQSVDWTYDSRAGLFKPSIDLKETTQGFAADSLTIPVVPPDDGYEEVPPLIPPPVYPPIPPISIASVSNIFPVLGGLEGDGSTPLVFGNNGWEVTQINGHIETWMWFSSSGTIVLTPLLNANGYFTETFNHSIYIYRTRTSLGVSCPNVSFDTLYSTITTGNVDTTLDSVIGGIAVTCLSLPVSVQAGDLIKCSLVLKSDPGMNRWYGRGWIMGFV